MKKLKNKKITNKKRYFVLNSTKKIHFLNQIFKKTSSYNHNSRFNFVTYLIL